jgi:hypothetical protein
VAEQAIIGIDPHKLPVTFEATDSREILQATGRFGTPRGQKWAGSRSTDRSASLPRSSPPLG